MAGRGPREAQIEDERERGRSGAPRFSGYAALLTRRQPLLYVTAALAAGILLDIFLNTFQSEPSNVAPFSHRLASLAWITCIALSGFFILGGKKAPATASLLIGFVAAGCVLSHLERSRPAESRLKRLFDAGLITPGDPVALTGTLVLPPEPAPGAYYLYVEAETIQTRGASCAATGRARLLVSLGDDESIANFDALALDYGSSIRAMVRLERGRHYGNPGAVDFNDFLERDGFDLKGAIKSPLLISRIESRKSDAPSNVALGWIYQARRGLVKAIDARFNAFTGGTLKAMLVDNRFFIDEDASRRLREGGTFHIISISGMHVGILAWVLLGGFFSPGRKRAKRGRAWKVGLVLLGLWSYAAMAGLAAPVTRAATMLTIALIAPLFFRRAPSINTMALAAFLMLAHTPSLIADPGFQLSFVAVAAIVTIAIPVAARLQEIGEWRPSARTPHPPRCSRPVRAVAEALFWNERRFRRGLKGSSVRYRMDKAGAALLLGRLRLQPLARGALLSLITSSAIQALTLPLTALYFNRVTPVGVLLNVATGLLTVVLMLASTCAMIVGSASESLAAPLVSLVDLSHHLLVYSVEPFRELSLSTFRVAHYEGWRQGIYGLYFLPLCLLAVSIDRWRPVERARFILEARGLSSRKDPLPLTGRATRRARRPLYMAFARAVLSPYTLLPAVLICSIVVARPAPASPDGRLRIHFLDVGQGDSALVIFPRGSTMLIDGGGEMSFGARGETPMKGSTEGSEEDGSEDLGATGPRGARGLKSREGFSIGEMVVSRFLWSLGYTRVDYLVATHGDADHIGGLSDVARNFDVGESIIGRFAIGEPGKDQEFQRFRETIAARSIPLGQVSAGQRFEIEGVQVEVLWPPARATGSSSNNDSLVIRFVYGPLAVLMTGDIERDTEKALARSRVNLRADILKAPHHGSKTSSSEDLLTEVEPECVVISVGERSRFGHPHEVVLDRYRQRSTRVFQTGRDGMVTVSADEGGYDVTAYRYLRH
ncbi:MAG TPA: ComEC/Rec2 family competence protein [Blastocatellia bacterium]|nr:ComEC/Rec2 family competence protein [Blastocatellia bacterium]